MKGIIKCLGIFGKFELQFNLVDFLLEEILINKKLTKMEDSLYNFWINSIVDPQQKSNLIMKYVKIKKQKEL